MNDVLPKPFTKDSLLGMLEKHLLHLKQMQEVGSSMPSLTENQRLIESPPDSRHATHPDALPQSTSRDKSPENLSVQFLHNQDYTTVYRPSTGGLENTYPQQQQRRAPKSTGKRRTVGERDPFEDANRSRTLPRSAGHNRASGKRAKHNTPSG
jgi:hypothetical protein